MSDADGQDFSDIALIQQDVSAKQHLIDMEHCGKIAGWSKEGTVGDGKTPYHVAHSDGSSQEVPVEEIDDFIDEHWRGEPEYEKYQDSEQERREGKQWEDEWIDEDC